MNETITSKEYKDALKLIELFRIEQSIPNPLETPEYKTLKEVTERYIAMLQKGVISDDDFKQEIFVAAMESIFGNLIWTWVEAHTKTRLRKV